MNKSFVTSVGVAATYTFGLLIFGLAFGVYSYGAGLKRAAKIGELEVTKARSQFWDDGFIRGVKVAMKHATCNGTNVMVDWSDVMKDNHGPFEKQFLH
jgi:hypothetical protein